MRSTGSTWRAPGLTDKERSSSASEKHDGGGKDALLREPGSSGVAANAAFGHKKEKRTEDGDQEEVRIAQGTQEALQTPMRDIKCKGSSKGTTSSSKRRKFYCYTCKIIIYSEEYGGT